MGSFGHVRLLCVTNFLGIKDVVASGRTLWTKCESEAGFKVKHVLLKRNVVLCEWF